MSISLGNLVKNQAFHASPGTVTISLSAGSVLFIQASMTSLSGAGAALTVSGVTSSNLTFAKLLAQSRHDVNIGAGATWHDGEVYWAYSPNALTSEVVSVAVTGGGSPNTGVIAASEIKGVLSPSAPFDGNASLPKLANNDNTNVQITGVSTNSSTPVGLLFQSSSFGVVTPTTPGTWTQVQNATDPGGSTQANTSFYYQVFASAQSSATWGATTTSRNWMEAGHAFAQVPIITGSFGILSGA